MFEEVAIESLTPLFGGKYTFAVRVPLRDGDTLLVQDCYLVPRTDGAGFNLFPPSKPTGGKYVRYVVFPMWLHNSILQAAARAVLALGAAQ